MNIEAQLVEMIRNHEKYVKASKTYVSVYSRYQQYGGPEEGGWWHTTYALQGSIAFPTREDAEAYLESAEQLVVELQQSADKEHRDAFVANHNDFVDIEDDFCRGETCGSDEFFVCIEEIQGSRDNSNEPIPHWE